MAFVLSSELRDRPPYLRVLYYSNHAIDIGIESPSLVTDMQRVGSKGRSRDAIHQHRLLWGQ